MKPSLRIATIAGATAAALSLVAGPAFAAPQMVATAGGTVSAPASADATAGLGLKVTPVALTLRHYQHAGLVAHISGFPAKTSVDAGYGGGQWGDYIGSFTTTAAGTADIPFTPDATHALAGSYTFGVNYTVPASSTAPVTAASTTTSAKSATGDTVTTVRSTYVAAGAAPSDPGSVTRSINVTYSVRASDAKVAWGTAHRSGTSIALKATATRWSATAKKYVPWHRATVKFQERIGGVWKTRTTVTTSTKGVAAKTVSAKVHTWRALVVSTKTTWGVSSKAHKK
jgi:hypothetical protein